MGVLFNRKNYAWPLGNDDYAKSHQKWAEKIVFCEGSNVMMCKHFGELNEQLGTTAWMTKDTENND